MTRLPRQTAAGLLLALGVVAVLYVAVMILPEVLVPDADVTGEVDESDRALLALQTERIQAQNSARAGILQALAGAALGAGAIATWRTVKVNQEGQVTERYTRAIDQLGHKDPSVRTGGIYALERIAHDSQRDRAAIVEVLVALVRRHATPTEEVSTPVPDDGPPLGSRAPHLQAAMTVLGRIAHTDEIRLGRVDLQKADLADADLTRADLTRAILAGANLTRANLASARLTDANLAGAGVDLAGARLTNALLMRANLADANLFSSDLAGADLSGADLTRANLAGVDLTRANLTDANLTRAKLRTANLTGANLMRTNLSDAILHDANLTRARLWETDLTDADLTRADLTRAILTRADLTDTKLPEGFAPPPDARGRPA